jgi:hypothetical protein
MPISVQCPGCSAKLNAPDAAAGKRVKCPKCQTAVPIPAADPIEAAEVVDDPSPPPARRKPEPGDEPDGRPEKKSSQWEDDDDRPKRKSRRDDDDGEDDRPKKRSRRDDGDDEDRPRSRRQRATARSGQSQMNVCGLLGLILGIPSIIVNFVPCCGWIPGIIGGLASLILGIIGLVLAKKSEGKMGGGLAIAGTALGGVATAFSLAWLAFFATAIATAPTTTGPAFGTGPATAPTGRTPNAGGVVKVTAEEMSEALDDDETAAHAKYDGKTLEVTGLLDGVIESGPAFPVTAELAGAKGGVRFDMAKGQQAKLASVPFGGPVTIRARYQKDKTPMLTEGEVVGTARHPDGADAKLRLIVVTQEYKFDKLRPGAADARFKGKTLEVEGEVREVDAGGPQGGTLQFNTDEPKAEARFAAKDANAFAALKGTDAVKVRGRCAGMVNGVLVLEGCVLVK